MAVCFGQTNYPYIINTVVGVNPLGDGGNATAALLEYPNAVAVDNSGNIFVGDNGNGRIRMVSAGKITTLAFGLAADIKAGPDGNFYAVDGVSKIYKVSPDGTITQIGGAGIGYSGDGGPALSAKFNGPSGIAIDSKNNIFIADTFNNRIRKITPDGIVTTYAGNGQAQYGGENISAEKSGLAYPWGMTIDKDGALYFSELYRIRKVSTAGIVTSLAGYGNVPSDGPAFYSAVGATVGLACDNANNLYLADSDYNMVRMITPGGNISTVAGTPTASYGGDGGFAFRALLNGPINIAVDASGSIYIADRFNHRIRKITSNSMINTVVGSSHFGGDGAPAAAALIHRSEHAIPDGKGNLYVSDTANHRIRKVDASGTITTIAGLGDCGFSGDRGPAVNATICSPRGIAFDASGNLFIADWGNNVVRRVDSAGFITTVAGNGVYGDSGDNGAPHLAAFKAPWGLAVNSAGDLFISDAETHRVRKVAAGIITTVVGTGTAGSSGDGGLATAALLTAPTHLTIGPDGSLFIADSGNAKIRKVTNGIISTVPINYVCPGGAANCFHPGTVGGVAVDAGGNVLISWLGLDLVTRTVAGGNTTAIAGDGIPTYTGDGVVATQSSLNSPAGISLDSAGDLYVADSYNNRIRKVVLNSPTALTATGGDGQTGNLGAPLKDPIVAQIQFRAGVGIAGIPVEFKVTSGSASLSASSSFTDPTGKAGVAVTLGNTAGPVEITATAVGLTPVLFHLTAASSVPLPTITAGGIVGGGGSLPPVTVISPGGFATIYGVNFAPAGTFLQPQTTSWPTQLGGVCVRVNGTLAFVTFVSATQINFQVPDVPLNANVTVQVVTSCGAADALQSATQTVATATASPEFLYWVKNADGKNPVIAVNAVNGNYIAAAGLIAGLTFVPAKGGDILTIYGVSFGPTNPATQPGIPSADIAASIYTPTVKLGTVTLSPLDVLYAGISPGTPGLYQLNIRVPSGLTDGDYAITMTLGSFSTPGGFLTVKN